MPMSLKSADPISDNQTDQTIIALTNGSADDRTRDHATAALLASVQKLINKTNEIERNLWKPSDLERAIDDKHKLACQACPVRRYVEEAQAKEAAQARHTSVTADQTTDTKGSKSLNFLNMFFKDPLSFGWVIANLGMLATIIILATGRDGFRDITNAAHLTKEKTVEVQTPQFPLYNQWWKTQDNE